MILMVLTRISVEISAVEESRDADSSLVSVTSVGVCCVWVFSSAMVFPLCFSLKSLQGKKLEKKRKLKKSRSVWEIPENFGDLNLIRGCSRKTCRGDSEKNWRVRSWF